MPILILLMCFSPLCENQELKKTFSFGTLSGMGYWGSQANAFCCTCGMCDNYKKGHATTPDLISYSEIISASLEVHFDGVVGRDVRERPGGCRPLRHCINQYIGNVIPCFWGNGIGLALSFNYCRDACRTDAASASCLCRDGIGDRPDVSIDGVIGRNARECVVGNPALLSTINEHAVHHVSRIRGDRAGATVSSVHRYYARQCDAPIDRNAVIPVCH